MVTQYPYQLLVSEMPESNYDETNGDWNTEDANFVPYGECRDEGNGSGRKVVTTDGELYVYFWVIYCPLSVQEMKKGSLIRVVDDKGNIRAEKRMVKFSRGQLNCRIWL